MSWKIAFWLAIFSSCFYYYMQTEYLKMALQSSLWLTGLTFERSNSGSVESCRFPSKSEKRNKITSWVDITLLILSISFRAQILQLSALFWSGGNCAQLLLVQKRERCSVNSAHSVLTAEHSWHSWKNSALLLLKG